MYLRHTTIRKDGKLHRYWRLVRSVRVGRRVIQQTVAQLGELDEHGRIEARALAATSDRRPGASRAVPVRLKGIRIERSRQFGATHGHIRLRCVTQPDTAQAALLDRLGMVLPKRMRIAEQTLPALQISA
jgi:hypothetical protein